MLGDEIIEIFGQPLIGYAAAGSHVGDGFQSGAESGPRMKASNSFIVSSLGGSVVGNARIPSAMSRRLREPMVPTPFSLSKSSEPHPRLILPEPGIKGTEIVGPVTSCFSKQM